MNHTTIPSRKHEFWAGVLAETPLLVATFPFGLIYGTLAIQVGLPALQAQLMSAIVFAGSAQMITTELVRTGTPGIVIVLTIAIVNLRHMLYSASVAPYLKRLSLLWKGVLAYLLTDEAFAVTITHYEDTSDREHTHWFFLGSGLALWTNWQISTALGILLGAVLPANLSLDFTLALTFIALVAPNLKDRPGVTAALVAGVLAIFTYNYPYKLGLILSALAGILAGMWQDRRK